MAKVPAVGWLFLDLDSYFASVEQQMDPALRGRPVGVVPVLSERTCVIAASYEAKAFGIRTGTPVWTAKALCPDIRLILARHDLYVEVHHRVLAEIDRHVPVTTVCSIDEVACRLIGDERPVDRARALALRIKSGLAERVGAHVRCSIGLAPNRFLAKVASDMQKPDGLVAILPDELPDRLLPLDLRDLPGIGPNMERRLQRAGVGDIEALWKLAPKQARAVWGSVMGERYWYALRGVDLSETRTGRRSVSHSHVLAPDLRNPEGARLTARRLTVKAASRMRRFGCTAGVFDLGLRFDDGSRWEGSFRLGRTQDTFTILAALETLWRQMRGRRGVAGSIKKVGVVLHGLRPCAAETADLFDRQAERRTRLAVVIDGINRRFGRDAVMLGASPRRDWGYTGTKIAFDRIPDRAEFHE